MQHAGNPFGSLPFSTRSVPEAEGTYSIQRLKGLLTYPELANGSPRRDLGEEPEARVFSPSSFLQADLRLIVPQQKVTTILKAADSRGPSLRVLVTAAFLDLFVPNGGGYRVQHG